MLHLKTNFVKCHRSKLFCQPMRIKMAYVWCAGAIDDKYDVAISTACGPLDNIVVDALETGQKCVDYLKKANLGVCTFILLDKMEQWVTKANKPIST